MTNKYRIACLAVAAGGPRRGASRRDERHAISFYQLLGGGLKDAGWMREHMSRNRLAILPNLTHYEVGAAPILAATVLPFLDGNGGSK